MTVRPKVGERRFYPGATIPVLYPGEQATAIVSLACTKSGCLAPIVEKWLIEPSPGRYAAYLRWRYRWFGWLYSWIDGRPQIETKVTRVYERR